MPKSEHPRLRIAVIGHVEHVVIGRVPSLPTPGSIVHLDPVVIAGGGGGISFHQLAKSPGEIHLFTAFGNDDAAAAVEASVAATGAMIHGARRDQPQTRDLVLITDDAERTIVVIGEPLHPRRDDSLPWDILGTCDAAYFTGQDPETIVAARAANKLVVTARRADALRLSGVRADVIVGSAVDPREASHLADYLVPPAALVMTKGNDGGTIETADGTAIFPPGRAPEKFVGSYGAGDSFAGALTWYLARGLPIVEACTRAGEHGAAVLAGANPVAFQLPLE